MKEPVLKGIDISHFEGEIDWALTAPEIGFAILRAGYGLHTDDFFEENLRGITAAGLHAGAYLYSYALTEEAAREEARNLLKIVSGAALDLPLWIDMEDADGYKAEHDFSFTRDHISGIVQAFIDTVREGGWRCGVYASKSWLEDYITVSADGIWLAQWAEEPTYSGHFDLWQNSDSGYVPGISGAVDTDLLYTEFWKNGEDMAMPIYRTLADVPDWGKAAVEAAMAKDGIDGNKILVGVGDGKLDLTEIDLRSIVREYRLGLYQ